MLAFQFERLFLLDVGRVHIAVMIGILELREAVVMRRHFHTHIEYFDFLKRRDVVVNDHPFRPHNRHLAHLPRVQPTALDQRRAMLAKCQMDVGHVFDPRRDVSLTAAIHADGNFLQNVKDDGDIVRRQVPRHVDILLKESQVQPARTDVAKLTNVAAINDFLDLPDRRRIKEGVPNHEHQPFSFGDLHQLFALFH